MKITKVDKILLTILLVLAIITIIASFAKYNSNDKQFAQIIVDGKLVKTVSLRTGIHEEYRIGDQNHYNIIEVENNKIRIREANCPDQVCVKTSWIDIAHQQIVCLPFRVVVKVVSEGLADIDDIAR